MPAQLHTFASSAALSAALGHYVGAVAAQHPAGFTVALSGGSLPKLLADALAPIAATIDFSKWHVFFADERCVSLEDPESNYKLCNDVLFQPLVGKNGSRLAPHKNVYTIEESLVQAPEQAARNYQSKVESMFRSLSSTSTGPTMVNSLPVFDLVLLGMGPDGHTCSLFPNHKLLHAPAPGNDPTLPYILSLIDSPKPPASRITFSLPLVNNARDIAFVCTGAGKNEVLKEVLEGNIDGGGSHEQPLPSALVQPINGSLRWFTDDAAAQLVTKVEKRPYKI